MPVPIGAEREFIHGGCLSEQKFGKFAKRWVVLEKCIKSGCMFLSVYRFSEDETNPVKENFKHQYILSEYEFIGTIKGRVNANRNSSFYWAIILRSEILQFQNKSLFVCENWNSKIRENIRFFNWEVRTGAGFKSSNQEAILYLTNYLLAVCYSDLSRVLFVSRLENILLFYSDGCRVPFRSNENGQTQTYEVEALRRSQAARIVEEVQARRSLTEDTPHKDEALSNEQPVEPVRSRKESFQVDDNYGSENRLTQTVRPMLTPPSTPGSLSPHMGSSPSGSPCPSPTTGRRHQKRASSPADVSTAQLSNETKNVADRLEIPGDLRLKRKHAFRRRRGRTAPSIILSSPVENPSEENAPPVPERPPWTLGPAPHPRKTLSLRNAPLQPMKSEECTVCTYICTCVLRGPVLPLPIHRPQECNTDTSPLSSSRRSREDILTHTSEVHTTPTSSPNGSSLDLVHSHSRSLSPRNNRAKTFFPDNFSPPVPEHGLAHRRKPDADFIDKLRKSEDHVESGPPIPERSESLSKVKGLCVQQQASSPPVTKTVDTRQSRQRKLSRDESCTPIGQRPSRVSRQFESHASSQSTCVVCDGPCECDNEELSLMSFVNSQNVDEHNPYVSMNGSGDPYLSMEGTIDLYCTSTDLTSTTEDGETNDSISIGELDPRKRPVSKCMKNGKPVPAPRKNSVHNNRFVESCSRKQRLSSDSAARSNSGRVLSYSHQSSKREFTKSFDDLYRLTIQDCEDSKCVDCEGPHTWPWRGTCHPCENLHAGRGKYSRISSNNGSTFSGENLFQLLFEYISWKSVPVDNLNIKPSAWTHFLISFDCEQNENELKDWRGLAELMGFSANDMEIVEEQCRKSSRVSSEFIMLYWANTQKTFLPYTRQNLLDVLENLDRMDLIEIIQNTADVTG